MTNTTIETNAAYAELLISELRSRLEHARFDFVNFYVSKGDKKHEEEMQSINTRLFHLHDVMDSLQREIERMATRTNELKKAATRTEINDILMDVLIDRLRATNSFRRGKDEAMADIYYGEVRGLIFAMRYMTAPMISNTQYTELDELTTEAYAGELDSTRRSDIQKKVEAILG